MTADEARRVAQIASNCDGGCSSCGEPLFNELIDTWPEHEAVFLAVWKDSFDHELTRWVDA